MASQFYRLTLPESGELYLNINNIAVAQDNGDKFKIMFHTPLKFGNGDESGGDYTLTLQDDQVEPFRKWIRQQAGHS